MRLFLPLQLEFISYLVSYKTIRIVEQKSSATESVAYKEYKLIETYPVARSN